MLELATLPGSPFPLGATWDGKGANFAIYSENATKIELYLFDGSESDNYVVLNLVERSGYIWHIYVKDIKPGQLYGYKVDGPYEPANGFRFNKNKLLLDPYSKAITSDIYWTESLFGYVQESEEKDLSFSELDSIPDMPRSVLVDQSYNWDSDRRPNTPLHRTVIYEAHVKGLTQLHPDIPEQIRGTYAGIAHPATIKYLTELGITAIELMPVHYFTDNKILMDRGLSNYWGYDTIGFFAPATKYCSDGDHGQQVIEFKDMVKALHAAGIEVILDVVYNHTSEGNELGPTLSFKGIDNTGYYRLAEDKRYYKDYTGTGNTLNATQPSVLRLIMDSLRYWILEMHVDGFRFDLAATLARGLHEVDMLSAFIGIIYQDPVISQVKLIAEPWDIGEGGYQVGSFPPGWSEWNGKYRDCMRNFWRATDSMLGEFAERFTGSSDLYQDNSRRPTASINFITAHDGFTLADLVAYNEKHNEQNGEDNRDGDDNNHSWNCGAEGPTDDAEIIKLRKKQQRNLLTTLFLSQGVPMLVAGDEIGKTQKGNNNAYCQDNEISWINWTAADKDLLEFTKKLIGIRNQHPSFCRKGWFKGQAIRGTKTEDIAWFKPDGNKLSEDDWNNGFAKSLAVYLNGNAIKYHGDKGEQVVDDSFYIMFNASELQLTYKLPAAKYSKSWEKLIDTDEGVNSKPLQQKAGTDIQVPARSIIVLRSKQ